MQASALPDRLRVEEAVRLFGNGDRHVGRPAVGHVEPRRVAAVELRLAVGRSASAPVHRPRLLNQPQVVFFDELTQGLDPLARSDVWDAIGDVRDRGTTVVLVTHFMDEAEALCDRVAVMRGGRIVDTGTPADLIARHTRTTTVTFTPPGSFDPTALGALPGVDAVERHGDGSGSSAPTR